MSKVSSHTATLATTIVGALVSVAAAFGFVVPQSVATSVVTVLLFVIALVAHLHSQKVALMTPPPAPKPTVADGATRGPGPNVGA